MKNVILFDDDNWQDLLPLTFTRPICELRVGILTIREKWEHLLKAENYSFITQDYLSEKYPIQIEDDNIIINSTILPSDKLVKLIQQMENNEAILYDDELIAARIDRKQFDSLINESPIEELNGMNIKNEDIELNRILRPYDIFRLNAKALEDDFGWITSGRKSAVISDTNQTIQSERIFLEEGAKVECSILNASSGPIYIGKNSEIMEGSVVRGGLALCEGSVLKLGAKIYGATTIGPFCKVGGEVNNSVFLGYSSKAHDGFLGNAVLGEWCNLGAGTNNSNLKNDYADVKLWSYSKNSFDQSGLQFCGLIMGDHSKCGINTMFNTGTVVGVSANIFGAGFPRNYIPSFAWGGAKGFTTYKLKKVFEVAEKVMNRRSKMLTDSDKKILEHIFVNSAEARVWEN